MRHYYNEHDPTRAEQLRGIMRLGVIPHGWVDERSIVDVRADELREFGQCHFFAGIGGWAIALRLAGWPKDRPVWTGSCPCQPYSVAGRGDGAADPRDLWPAWFQLISQRRPATVFGEQVAASVRFGWFDRLADDMEGESYAIGAADLPAGAVGAWHRRERLWFVADDQSDRRDEGYPDASRLGAGARPQRAWGGSPDYRGGDLADYDDERREGGALPVRAEEAGRHAGEVPDAAWGGVGDSQRERLEGLSGHERHGHKPGRERAHEAGSVAAASWPDWAAVEWIPCRDGNARPAQPGVFPLVDGVSRGRSTVGDAIGSAFAKIQADEAAHVYSVRAALEAAGNAIVPQVAAEFIAAYLEAL